MRTIVKNIKRWYTKGFYTKEMVLEFLTAGLITPSEYKEITGEEYHAPEQE